MGFRDRNKTKRKQMANKYEEAAGRDVGGGGSKAPKSLINWDNVPENVPQWIPKKGEHFFDIVPFEAGKSHPTDSAGDLSINVEYFQHSKIGPGYGTYPCNLRNVNKPCPICEYIQANRLDKDDWSKVKPKWYVAYLAAVYSTDEETDKGVQIFTCAHFFMQDTLNKLQTKPRTGEKIEYADYDDGKTISFIIEESGKYIGDNNKEYPSTKWTGHQLTDREDENGAYVLEDSFLDASFALDEALTLEMDYDELKEIFYAGQVPGGQNDEKTPDKPESGRGRGRGRGKSNGTPAKSQKPARRPTSTCPEGFNFGKDFKEDEKCDECESFDDCEASYELSEQDKPVPKKEPTPEPAPAPEKAVEPEKKVSRRSLRGSTRRRGKR